MAEAGFASIGMPDEQRAGRLLPQAPAREIEGVDVHGDAVARRQQMMAWKFSALASRTGFSVEQGFGRAEAGAEPGVIFQRADAAVDVDRRVDLGVAGIGDGDLFVARAVGDEHVGDGAQQLGAFGVIERAQGRPAALARVRAAPPCDRAPVALAVASTLPLVGSMSSVSVPCPRDHRPPR